MLEQFLDQVADLHLAWLALLAFALPFGETVAFLDVIVPGEVGLVFVGAAARTPDRVLVVYVLGVCGAFCGDSTSWYIGRRWGVAVLSRWSRLWRHAEPALERAGAHFDRHGGRSVFLARFVGALRALTPLVAGASGLRYRTFAPWNALASLVWVGLVVGLGAAFGERIVSTVDRFATALSIIVLALISALLIRRWRRVRS